jgi:hypothetical protein
MVILRIAPAAVLTAILTSQAAAQTGQIPFSISGQGITASGTLTYQPVTLSGFSGTAWQVTGVTGNFSDSVSTISGRFTSVLASGMDYTKAPSRQDPGANPPIVGNLGTITGSPVQLSYGISTKSSFDNLVYPNGDSPTLCLPYYSYGGGPIDIFGLGLLVDTGGGSTALVNVWSNGNLNHPSNPIGLDYGISVGPYDPSGSPQYTRTRYIGDSNGYEGLPTSYVGSGLTVQVVPEPSIPEFAAMAAAGFLGLWVWGRRRA